MRVIGTIVENGAAVRTTAHASLLDAREAFRRYLDAAPVVLATAAGGPSMTVAPGASPDQSDLAYTHEIYVTSRGAVGMRRTTRRRLRRMSKREFGAFCRAVGIKDDLSRGPLTGERLNAVASTLTRGINSATLARTTERAMAYVQQLAAMPGSGRKSISKRKRDRDGGDRSLL